MAKDHSLDIAVKFDFQELRNAVDQAQRETITRYDLKDAGIEIELTEENIKVTAQTEMQLEAVYGILLQKIIKRGVSPKILDKQKVEPIGGMRVKQEYNLITTMDKEGAKKVSKMIKENFDKAKPSIQGDTIRVTSPSIDQLRSIMDFLNKSEEIMLPLDFSNFK